MPEFHNPPYPVLDAAVEIQGNTAAPASTSAGQTTAQFPRISAVFSATGAGARAGIRVWLLIGGRWRRATVPPRIVTTAADVGLAFNTDGATRVYFQVSGVTGTIEVEALMGLPQPGPAQEPRPTDQLGAIVGAIGDNNAPTQATDGYDVLEHRYVNLYCKSSVGTSWDLMVYFYNSTTGWALYDDVPTTTVTSTGKVMQIEPRGAERVYVRTTNYVGGGETADVQILGGAGA